MEKIVKDVVDLLKQGINAVFDFLALVWSWSFGQVVEVFQSDPQSLPIWKLIVLVIVVGAIAYVFYKAGSELWAATLAVFHSFIALFGAFVSVVPYVIVAGLVAFAGGYVIKNVNAPFLDKIGAKQEVQQGAK